MPRTFTLLLVSASLLGATALSACGGDDSGSTAGAATPAKTAAPGPAAEKSASGSVKATIAGFAFAPKQIKVKVGQKITWTNDDAASHTVTAQSGAAFDSGTLAQGATFTWKAAKPGTISYLCAIHPSMTGTITVE
jgi:plastocyanin